MKKVLSVFVAGFLLAGALAAFSGCVSEMADEALASEIFYAVAMADIRQFELTSNSELNYTYTSKDSKRKSSSKQQITGKGFVRKGKLSADLFTNESSRSEEKTDTKTTKETHENYQMEFTRAGETYATSGAWSDVKAGKGKFAALVTELKKNDTVLTGSYEASAFGELNESSVQSFGEMAMLLGAKAYTKGSGYLFELDLVTCQEQILLGYESALEEYRKKPAMTVSEFLQTDFIAKFLAMELDTMSASETRTALVKALRKQGIYVFDSDCPSILSGISGAEYLQLCLDDEKLFSEIMFDITGHLWEEGGTLGGALMSTIFGTANGLLKKVREGIENPQAALLVDMFNFDNGENDSGSIDSVVTVQLDREMNVTSASLKLNFSMTEKPSDTTTRKQSGKTNAEFKALKKAPELCDLSGFHANMGYQLTPGEYEIPEGSRALYLGPSGYINGTCRGTATVTSEHTLIVEVTYTFTEGGATYSVSEQREHDLWYNNSDLNRLFAGRELPDGKKVSSYGGLDYYFSVYPRSGIFNLKIGSYDVEIPNTQTIKNL